VRFRRKNATSPTDPAGGQDTQVTNVAPYIHEDLYPVPTGSGEGDVISEVDRTTAQPPILVQMEGIGDLWSLSAK
jgi:hypothetical protein